MKPKSRNIALSPRMWLSAGLFCFGAATVVTYHQDQKAANMVMAEKVGFPSQVMIQDFIPERHTNVLDEVDLLLEAGFGKSISLNLGTDASPQMVDVVPLYSVSSEAFPLAMGVLREGDLERHRPVSRSEAHVVASRNASLTTLANQPLGYALFDNTARGTATIDVAHGLGQNGPLISMTGARLEGETLFSKVSAAMAEKGIVSVPDMLMVTPYSNRRLAVSDGSEYTYLRRALVWIGVILASLSMTSVWPDLFKNVFRRLRKKKVRYEDTVPAVGAFPAVGFFQPIKTQDELRIEEEAREAEAIGPTGRVISRIMG